MTEIVQGVGSCPKRDGGLGHVWKSWRVDPRRSCEFCGRPGRGGDGGAYWLMQNGTGDPAKLLMFGVVVAVIVKRWP